MILDVIIQMVLAPIYGLINLLPAIEFTVPSDIVQEIYSLCVTVGYFLPVKTVATIIGIKLSIWTFRFSWNCLTKAKSFIPTMGG